MVPGSKMKQAWPWLEHEGEGPVLSGEASQLDKVSLRNSSWWRSWARKCLCPTIRDSSWGSSQQCKVAKTHENQVQTNMKCPLGLTWFAFVLFDFDSAASLQISIVNKMSDDFPFNICDICLDILQSKWLSSPTSSSLRLQATRVSCQRTSLILILTIQY